MNRVKREYFTVILSILVFLACVPDMVLALGETGNVCVSDYRPGAVCTANDVRIEAMTAVAVVEDCLSGTPGEMEIVFETLISSAGTPDRYDIGLFFALDSGSANDGDSCYHDYLSGILTATPTYSDKNSDTIPDVTDGPWWDGSVDGDTCGDIETNTQVFKTLPSLRFPCLDSNGDGSTDVSVCTSWDNSTGTACNSVVDAFPGTNSKCNCTSIELGIAPEPAITITKSPASQNIFSGGTANFTFTITGNTTVSNVVVSDPDCDASPVKTGGDINTDSILTPDETWTYTCSKTNVLADFMNTVTVTGDGPLGPVNDTDTANVTVSSASIALGKSGIFNDANFDGFSQAGETISYSFTVTNTGTVPLNNVAITDPMVAPITCPSGNPIPILAVAAMETCTGSYVIVQADVEAGQKVNTATATSDETSPVMDTTTVTLPADTTIGVAKYVSGFSIVGKEQYEVIFEYTVENFATTTLTNVQVIDDLAATFPAPVTFSIQTAPAATGTLVSNAAFNGTGDMNLLNAGASTLSVGANHTISVTVRFATNGSSGPFYNTAIASAEGYSGASIQDTSDDGADPDPDGDGNPDEPGENDPTPITVPTIGISLVKIGFLNDGGDGFASVGDTIMYTFDLINTGVWTLTNVVVTDPLPGLSAIICPGGNPVPSIEPSETVQCTGAYTLTQADINAGQVDNTATATSDQTFDVQASETVTLPVKIIQFPWWSFWSTVLKAGQQEKTQQNNSTRTIAE